jgi:hypothetical protein
LLKPSDGDVRLQLLEALKRRARIIHLASCAKLATKIRWPPVNPGRCCTALRLKLVASA